MSVKLKGRLHESGNRCMCVHHAARNTPAGDVFDAAIWAYRYTSFAAGAPDSSSYRTGFGVSHARDVSIEIKRGATPLPDAITRKHGVPPLRGAHSWRSAGTNSVCPE
ncbi:hypothetical protein MRX96_019792 [Rhipicephalus microplus]